MPPLQGQDEGQGRALQPLFARKLLQPAGHAVAGTGAARRGDRQRRSPQLRDVANVREHRGTHSRPLDRLPVEQQRMLPYESTLIEAPAAHRARVPLPVESLQHPLSVYAELLQAEVPA